METPAFPDTGSAADTTAVSVSLHAVASDVYTTDNSASIPSTSTPSNAHAPKKTGRPAHPLWAHFHRGEKRNRYHYHSFCAYCVERYGANNVTPTRGVSIDMLRHLEKCTNCPRQVVEHIKEVCGRRDAARFDRYGKKKQADDMIAAAVQATTAVSGGFHHQSTQRTSTQVSTGSTTSSVPQQRPTETAVIQSNGVVRSSLSDGVIALPPNKRIRTDTSPTLVAQSEEDDKVALLKLAVSAGFSPECFENPDVQQLLAVLRPGLSSPTAPTDVFAGITDPAFLKETVTRLAAVQLDRVKEGMLNSTIKGGLTLSLHSWTTLDGQHLVAFNLVNSNGESACVGVEDMALFQSPVPSVAHTSTTTAAAPPYSSQQLAVKIEEVLAKLQAQNISVMGIVADSTLGLNAARRVASSMNKRQSLLVVPCFSRLLSVLAGAVLTHAHFVGVVSEMIEIAAYLLNTKLLEAVRTISGDPQACFVLPSRDNWFSFVECHSRLMKYQDTIISLCQSGAYTTPHVFKTLVLRDNQAIWKKLQTLGLFLAPLHETYSVFFQLQHKSEADDSTSFIQDDLTAAHGLTLAHVMYQFARMMQQYQTLLVHDIGVMSSPALQDVAQLVLIYVDTMWRRYELPAMLLAFVFNFHLDTTLLDMTKPCSSWPSIAQYFQVYFQRWFGDPSAPNTVAITSERVTEILDAIKLNQFPFDADTTSDYADVSSFYSFVSDTHPEICALCCRLYAISLFTANASKIVKGIGYVPNAAQTTRDPAAVETLLHIGFATNLRRHATAVGGNTSALGGMEGMIEVASESVLWGEDVWQGHADDWRLFVDQELLMDEFDAITQASASGDATSAMLAVKVPVQELFDDTLSPVAVPLDSATPPPVVGTVTDGTSSGQDIMSVGI